jgi:hypothetical protein
MLCGKSAAGVVARGADRPGPRTGAFNGLLTGMRQQTHAQDRRIAQNSLYPPTCYSDLSR